MPPKRPTVRSTGSRLTKVQGAVGAEGTTADHVAVQQPVTPGSESSPGKIEIPPCLQTSFLREIGGSQLPSRLLEIQRYLEGVSVPVQLSGEFWTEVLQPCYLQNSSKDVQVTVACIIADGLRLVEEAGPENHNASHTTESVPVEVCKSARAIVLCFCSCLEQLANPQDGDAPHYRHLVDRLSVSHAFLRLLPYCSGVDEVVAQREVPSNHSTSGVTSSGASECLVQHGVTSLFRILLATAPIGSNDGDVIFATQKAQLLVDVIDANGTVTSEQLGLLLQVVRRDSAVIRASPFSCGGLNGLAKGVSPTKQDQQQTHLAVARASRNLGCVAAKVLIHEGEVIQHAICAYVMHDIAAVVPALATLSRTHDADIYRAHLKSLASSLELFVAVSEVHLDLIGPLMEQLTPYFQHDVAEVRQLVVRAMATVFIAHADAVSVYRSTFSNFASRVSDTSSSIRIDMLEFAQRALSCYPQSNPVWETLYSSLEPSLEDAADTVRYTAVNVIGAVALGSPRCVSGGFLQRALSRKVTDATSRVARAAISQLCALYRKYSLPWIPDAVFQCIQHEGRVNTMEGVIEDMLPAPEMLNNALVAAGAAATSHVGVPRTGSAVDGNNFFQPPCQRRKSMALFDFEKEEEQRTRSFAEGLVQLCGDLSPTNYRSMLVIAAKKPQLRQAIHRLFELRGVIKAAGMDSDEGREAAAAVQRLLEFLPRATLAPSNAWGLFFAAKDEKVAKAFIQACKPHAGDFSAERVLLERSLKGRINSDQMRYFQEGLLRQLMLPVKEAHLHELLAMLVEELRQVTATTHDRGMCGGTGGGSGGSSRLSAQNFRGAGTRLPGMSDSSGSGCGSPRQSEIDGSHANSTSSPGGRKSATVRLSASPIGAWDSEMCEVGAMEQQMKRLLGVMRSLVVLTAAAPQYVQCVVPFYVDICLCLVPLLDDTPEVDAAKRLSWGLKAGADLPQLLAPPRGHSGAEVEEHQPRLSSGSHGSLEDGALGRSEVFMTEVALGSARVLHDVIHAVSGIALDVARGRVEFPAALGKSGSAVADALVGMCLRGAPCLSSSRLAALAGVRRGRGGPTAGAVGGGGQGAPGASASAVAASVIEEAELTVMIAKASASCLTKLVQLPQVHAAKALGDLEDALRANFETNVTGIPSQRIGNWSGAAASSLFTAHRTIVPVSGNAARNLLAWCTSIAVLAKSDAGSARVQCGDIQTALVLILSQVIHAPPSEDDVVDAEAIKGAAGRGPLVAAVPACSTGLVGATHPPAPPAALRSKDSAVAFALPLSTRSRLVDVAVKALASIATTYTGSRRMEEVAGLMNLFQAAYVAVSASPSPTVGGTQRRLSLLKRVLKLLLPPMEKSVPHELLAADLIAQEDNLVVRRLIQAKLVHWIQKTRCDVHMVALLLLTAVKEDSKAGYAHLRHLTRVVNEHLRAQREAGGTTLQEPAAVYTFMEYTIPFIVLSMARSPLYEVERTRLQFVGFQRVWHVLFEELFRASRQNVGFVNEMLSRIKQADVPVQMGVCGGADGTSDGGSSGEATRVICELAQRIMVERVGKHPVTTEDLKRYCGVILLPNFFSRPSSTAVGLERSQRVYLDGNIRIGPNPPFRVPGGAAAASASRGAALACGDKPAGPISPPMPKRKRPTRPSRSGTEDSERGESDMDSGMSSPPMGDTEASSGDSSDEDIAMTEKPEQVASARSSTAAAAGQTQQHRPRKCPRSISPPAAASESPEVATGSKEAKGEAQQLLGPIRAAAVGALNSLYAHLSKKAIADLKWKVVQLEVLSAVSKDATVRRIAPGVRRPGGGKQGKTLEALAAELGLGATQLAELFGFVQLELKALYDRAKVK